MEYKTLQERDLSQQHREPMSERERFREEILRKINDIVRFMDNANAMLGNNTAFEQFTHECVNEIMDNTVYLTVASDDFDCCSREFDMYLTYIGGRCDNVIETVKDFRKLTTNRFLYMILNRIENDLEKVKKMVNYMVNKAQEGKNE